MKIAFIGNHSISFSTESHHAKTFEKLGHTVIRFQENSSSVDAVMKEAVNCDMLYFTHTHSYRLDTNERMVYMFTELKRLNIPTVGYHLDLFMGIERQKDLQTDPYWQIEHFFTVDKSMSEFLNANTQIKGYYLPAGVYEDETYMTEPDLNKFPHEIVFTGSFGYHSEYPYRQKLINWLKETYGNKFAHYGGGGHPTKRGHELNVLYASAKIVIGDTLCKDFNYSNYFSDRAFEVPGRGGFMIFPYIKGIEEMYDLGKDIATYTYNDFEGLRKAIDYYLENNELRESMRLSGHNKVKSTHTYSHRLTSLLSTLNLK